VAEALARTARLVQADLDALDELAAGHPADDPSLDVGALQAQPQAIRTRVLRAWTRRNGVGPLTAGHIAAVEALITDWHGQIAVDLPGGFAAVRASGRLHLQHKPPEEL
jgi:tRNA(Ile)-lysidine synthase